jgi:hypothetical protein
VGAVQATHGISDKVNQVAHAISISFTPLIQRKECQLSNQAQNAFLSDGKIRGCVHGLPVDTPWSNEMRNLLLTPIYIKPTQLEMTKAMWFLFLN